MRSRVLIARDAWAHIAPLLRSRGPADIARFVMTIVVDAINGMLRRWAWTDVRKKYSEVVLPFLTNGNTSCAVVAMVLVLWLEAAIPHASPSVVLGAALTATAVTVSTTKPTVKYFALETSAGCALAIFQGAFQDRALYPTGTSAHPRAFGSACVVTRWPGGDNYQAAETLADHGSNYTAFRQLVGAGGSGRLGSESVRVA